MLRLAQFHLVLILFLPAVALVGCGGGSRAVMITVTDAITHEPIPRAAVKAKATRFFIPAPPYMFVNPIAYEDFSTFTDDLGRAGLRAYTERPTHVEITADGYLRFTGFLEYRGERTNGSHQWLLDSPRTPVDRDDPLVAVTVTDNDS